MQLYYFETMNPQKACATAKYLGLPVTYVRLDPQKGEHKRPEHLARNPNGKVPVLVDGELTLWESVAIMAHLSNKAGSDLWPAHDPAAQVEVLRWLSWDAFQFVRFTGVFYFEHCIKPMLGLGAPDSKALAVAAGGFHESAHILDQHLSTRTFLLGDRLSIADFAVGMLLPQAE